MNRWAVPIVLTLVLMAMPMPVSAATTSRALTIDTTSAGPSDPFRAFDGDPAKVFDFDGDGTMEIIVHNDNKHVYVFDSKDGTLDADITTKYPPGWGARPINGVEAIVLEYGGVPHLVVANSAAYITVLRYEDGPSHKGAFQFTKLWEVRADACFDNPSMDAKPVLYDLDDDGQLEILVQTEETGVYAFRMDGSTMWSRCISGGNGEPAVDDMDGDGIPEVVWASDGGIISIMNGRIGTTRCTFWANHPSYNLGSASVPVGPTIGQVDGTGAKEVVFGARDSHNANDWSTDHAALFVVKLNCQLLWMRQDSEAAPLTYTHPIVADTDDNGQAEIYWADWNTVGHKPPYDGDTDPAPWAPTGPAHFYRYDKDGNMVWRQSLYTYWQNKDLALADVDADGVQEILANGPGPGGDGIWYLDSRTGAKETFISTAPWKVTRGPIVEDLWDTGTMQWLVPVGADSSSVSGGAIMVFDTHAPYDADWPHLPYPVAQQGSTPPPDPQFTATFTVPSNVNNWWVEVKVDSPSIVTEVTVSVDAGAPRPLTLKSWGNWADSFYVADGASVVFTATSSLGETATSPTFNWLGAPPPPPPGEGFDATFTPVNVNNWWLEVRVDATQTVDSVTATVDGGTPKLLDKQSWGNWARSFYMPDGAEIVFTAKDGAGHTVTSEAFYPLGPPPPPPSGVFEATFDVSSSVNNWWVDVKVTANHPLSGVTATVDGGTPRALSQTSWGTWAKSFYVPTGASVVFTATDTSSDSVQSDPVPWLTDSGPFTATFKAGDPSNNWWVEVYVKSNRPLSSVEAQVNGGAWTTLPKTDWGSYAKSFFVPDGAQVTFRATSTEAETITSAPVTWI